MCQFVAKLQNMRTYESCRVAVFPTRIGVSGALGPPAETIAVLRMANFLTGTSVAKLSAYGDDFPEVAYSRA